MINLIRLLLEFVIKLKNFMIFVVQTGIILLLLLIFMMFYNRLYYDFVE